MLGGKLAVLQPPMFERLAFDRFSLFDYGFRPAELGVGGRDVSQACVIAMRYSE